MPDDLIIDVGLHSGQDTAYYLALGYRVVAIEADPTLANAAGERFREQIDSGQLTIQNIGIADSEGELPFYLSDKHSEWNSFHKEISTRGGATCREIIIPTCRFGSILEKFGIPKYLKIDIEGNDYLCLEDLNPQALPESLSVEVSAVKGLNIPKKLFDLGYSKFKCISQVTHLPLDLTQSQEEKDYLAAKKALESSQFGWRVFRKLGGRRWLQKRVERIRKEGDWVFPPGSTGRFGDATPGEWRSFEQICEIYEHFKKLNNESPAFTFWADYHVYKPEITHGKLL